MKHQFLNNRFDLGDVFSHCNNKDITLAALITKVGQKSLCPVIGGMKYKSSAWEGAMTSVLFNLCVSTDYDVHCIGTWKVKV